MFSHSAGSKNFLILTNFGFQIVWLIATFIYVSSSNLRYLLCALCSALIIYATICYRNFRIPPNSTYQNFIYKIFDLATIGFNYMGAMMFFISFLQFAQLGIMDMKNGRYFIFFVFEVITLVPQLILFRNSSQHVLSYVSSCLIILMVSQYVYSYIDGTLMFFPIYMIFEFIEGMIDFSIHFHNDESYSPQLRHLNLGYILFYVFINICIMLLVAFSVAGWYVICDGLNFVSNTQLIQGSVMSMAVINSFFPSLIVIYNNACILFNEIRNCIRKKSRVSRARYP